MCFSFLQIFIWVGKDANEVEKAGAPKIGLLQTFNVLIDFYHKNIIIIVQRFHIFFIHFLSCSKRICRYWPLRSQRTAHHHHQTGSRAFHFHWLVPGLGFQDVGHRPFGKNPCLFLNPKLQALSLQIYPLTCPALPFAILFYLQTFSAKTNVVTVQRIKQCSMCDSLNRNASHVAKCSLIDRISTAFLHCPLGP